MNLPETLTAIANYYDAALVRCERPVCATYRYVGQVGVVSGPGACDCTCEPETSDGPIPQGVLRVSWKIEGPSITPPSLSTLMAPKQPSMPMVELWIRVMRCWPTAPDTTVEQWDTAAAGIAADADCLMCATEDLLCMKPTAYGEVGLEGCAALGGYRITPVWPDGGCAGNELQLFARLTCSL